MDELTPQESITTDLLQIEPELDEVDREIIRLKIQNPGISFSELGRLIGCDRHKISDRIEDKNLDKFVREKQESALQILLDAQVDAAKTIVSIMNGEKTRDENKISVAKEILKGVLSDKSESTEQIKIEFVNYTEVKDAE